MRIGFPALFGDLRRGKGKTVRAIGENMKLKGNFRPRERHAEKQAVFNRHSLIGSRMPDKRRRHMRARMLFKREKFLLRSSRKMLHAASVRIFS